ncbi:MAG: hypothetical protein EBY03_01430 [Actinobacteria bacterium]|nr:hypothetical protein [Actinomycetota bacterium]
MKKVFSIAAISVALLLTGCSQVSSAASVGSVKISQSTVQSSINDIMAERSKVDTSQMQLETGEALNRAQMRFHVLSELLNKVAAKLKITVDIAKENKVTINPRYGVWDALNADVVPVDSAGSAVTPSDK